MPSLKITRPIVFFDLETTGLNLTHDRIVEISVVKIMPGKEDEPIVKTRRVNPEMPISPEATAVHHITDADVASEPTFKQIAHSLAQFISGCDIAGFNSNRFDVPMLDEEFRRVGVDFDFHRARFIDVQTIFHKMEPRTLTAAYRFYCGKELEDAHSASADTMATYEVLLAQLHRYDSLPGDVESLSKFSSQNDNVDLAGRIVRNEQGVEVFNFGKHRGKPVTEVFKREPAYYDWIQNGDFSADTKAVITRLYMNIKK